MSHNNSLQPDQYRPRLLAAGLPEEAVNTWLTEMASLQIAGVSNADSLESDARAAGTLINRGWAFCAALPPRSQRSDAERAAGDLIVRLVTTLCRDVCRVHRSTMYALLTKDFRRFIRTEELVFEAAARWPGLLPSRAELEAESGTMQKDKDGLELNQGIFFSQLFMDPQAGIHHLHAMLRPKPESEALLDTFIEQGGIKLDYVTVEVKGKAGYVYLSNPRYLNAEDDLTSADLETAVDLVLLHPHIDIGVLRGGPIDHPKYHGRRVFGSGVNLTKIYQGKLPYLMFLTRDIAPLNKLYYGLAGDTWNEDDPHNTLEKPWLAAVETFAIGGGCQLLLVMDYVLAEAGSYFSLPARKEGIIPGVANLRLARFVGESAAREGILFDKQFDAESPEAAGRINRVVAPGDMDAAIEEFIGNALDSGMVSAAGNRKVLRIGQENLELYRRYMANFAEIQAWCHLSPQLIQNLEKYWNARERKL
ncbi:MAG: enoyl-CoA hydratase/isomerase family protein [Gammaproteobacteria bacterium]